MATVQTELRKADETSSTDQVTRCEMDGRTNAASRPGRQLWPVVCLLLCGTGTAVSARPVTNDYSVIVDRNLFGLRPVPAPPPGPEPPAPPKITLTGITTILGDKEVLMKVQVPAKPPQPPKEQSLILSEGQRKDGIQVLAINLKTDDVTIDEFGTVVTLNLEKDGAKLNSPPPLPVALGRSAANRQWPGRQFLPPSLNPIPFRTPFSSTPARPEVRSGLNRLAWPRQ